MASITSKITGINSPVNSPVNNEKDKAPIMTQTNAAPSVKPALVNPAPAVREVSSKAKEALVAYQEAQKKAKVFIISQLYGANADKLVLPEDFRKALEVLVPNKKHGASGSKAGAKATILDQLAEMFGRTVGTNVSLMDIFKGFRMGEGEMRVRMRNMIYDRKPAERLWISYNADAETYTLEGLGENPPKGWRGVLPKTSKTTA